MNVALARKQHESFCLYYLYYMSTMNGSQSALAAGYSARNPKNAHIIAWTLLKREDVQARLKELRKATTDEAIMTIIEIKQVLSQIGRARLKDYQDSNGRFRPLDDDAPNPSAIAEVTYGWDPVKREAYPIRIRLHDAIDAIAELCRLDGSYKKPGSSVTVAPIVSVSVDQARAKILAKMKAVIAEMDDGYEEAVQPLGKGRQEETSGKASR